MKRIVLIVLIACVAFIGCQAKEAEASGDWDPCDSRLSGIFNDCAPQEKDIWEYGVGVDVPLWKAKNLIVDQETKLVLNNGVNSDGIATYTVFKPQMEKGLFQIVGDFINKILGRE